LDVDAIVTDCAACGAELKKYGKALSADPEYAARAAAFSAKVYGLSEFLKRRGLRGLPEDLGGERAKVTYQDACHLCHGQGVCDQPRDLLRANPLLDYRELEHASDCCGSAGVYNVTHPQASQAILDKKVERVRDTGAEILAAENPGCLLQMESGVRQHGLPVEVAHTSVLLQRAYRAADLAAQGRTPGDSASAEGGAA
ncbi:MAG TPA: (Fe-S)-binding protein, partial [Deinococcales bacterium]|nr:(Fe-S)-binding protein [Deinococcales bacterium]